jgi:hypothetical protein
VICILAKERFCSPSFTKEQASIQLVQPEHFLESTTIYAVDDGVFFPADSWATDAFPVATGAVLAKSCLKRLLPLPLSPIRVCLVFTMDLLLV